MIDYAVIFAICSLVVGAAAWLLATRLRLGPVLSPFSIALLVLVSIFGVRPLLLSATGDSAFYGHDVLKGFAYSAGVGLVGISALCAGYYVANEVQANSTERMTRANGESDDAKSLYDRIDFVLAAKLGLATVLVWLAAQLYVGGGIDYLGTLFAGRSSENAETQAGIPSIVSALPVVAAISVAFLRIRKERNAKLNRAETRWFWIVVIAAVVPPTALGSRRFLIPTIIASACAVGWSSWSARIRVRYFVLGAAGFIVLSAIPYVRSAGARTTESTSFVEALLTYFQTEGVFGALSQYFVSYDTEMFDYIALLHINLLNGFPYGVGRASVGEFVLNPLPASVSPTLWSDQLLIYNFGGPCTQPYCPVLSTVGVLAADGGVLLVAAGMLLLGALMARPTHYLERGSLRAVSYFCFWVFVPASIRGNTPLILSIGLQVVVLVLLGYWALSFSSRRTGQFPRASGVSNHGHTLDTSRRRAVR
ncbi:hypothetical protein [Actinomycetospora sp. CA-053990]|uniref:hypothetical protein n=1 Tax=Actinomycetospora sp. CA-053990 TaxID=3239891 RepID=UPI003D8C999C